MNLRKARSPLFGLALGVLTVLSLTTVAPVALADDPPRDAHTINRLLGRGVNLGNALEAPREGEWGLTLQDEYFDLIRAKGFQTVRIPIRWSAHAEHEPPYAIRAAFFERVDWAIDQALSRGLAAVINVHHYEEMDQNPDEHLPRLVALWRQIAERYQDHPDLLVFELYNEPHDNFTAERWNQAIPRLLETIRQTNPDRVVIVGPAHWNNINQLPTLELPDDDRQVIVTFHYYLPFPFTHQGASWVRGSDAWLGTTWDGTPEEVEALRSDFAGAAAWAQERDRPLFLGEFGVYSRADQESRVRWTGAVAREAETHGMSWAYWEFGAGFGIYDPQAQRWREPLLRALVPEAP